MQFRFTMSAGGYKVMRMAAQHAPKGGISIGGKQFTGGQFIPGEVLKKATKEEKAKLEGGGDKRQKSLGEAIGKLRKQPHMTDKQIEFKLGDVWFNDASLRKAFGDKRKAFQAAVKEHFK